MSSPHERAAELNRNLDRIAALERELRDAGPDRQWIYVHVRKRELVRLRARNNFLERWGV